ncbi:MAG: PTS galactosamine transporter subunit IIB [Bacilli bacterium]
MANIVFTRVDNRLVHGQVGCTWTSSLGANLLVVADDVVADDSLQQDLMGITAQSSGVGIRFFSIDKTIEIINKASAKQKIFLVVRDLQSACRLVKGGVPITKLNLGNLHFSEGKRKLSSKVYVDDNDMTCIEEIKQLNVEVFIQDVPQDDIKKL